VKALRSLVDPWVERPLLDYAITAAAVSALVAFAPRGLVSRDHWDGLYQTLASVSGILLSLGTVIVTLLFTVTPNERLLRVIAIVGHDLLRLALSSLTMLVLTTVGFLALFGLDDASGTVRIVFTSALLVMMVLRFVRLWWLVNKVMQVLVAGMSTSDAKPWVRPRSQPDDHAVPLRQPPRTPVS
jgi:hypothetical protein